MLKVRSSRLVVLFMLLLLGVFVSGNVLYAQRANVRLSHVSIDSLVSYV